jgi:hypothetical protein
MTLSSRIFHKCNGLGSLSYPLLINIKNKLFIKIHQRRRLRSGFSIF